MRIDTLWSRERDYDAEHAAPGEQARGNPYRDLRQRLAWRSDDAIAEFEKSRDDIAKWRGLGR